MMKRCFIWLWLMLLLVHAVRADEAQDSTRVQNGLCWGVSVEGTCWLEDGFELMPRLSTELLLPLGEHLSVGAFASVLYMDWEAGVMASWHRSDCSRIMLGAGYSRALEVPLVRVGYKTRGPWYFQGTVGYEPGAPGVCLGMGVGYAFFRPRQG